MAVLTGFIFAQTLHVLMHFIVHLYETSKVLHIDTSPFLLHLAQKR